MDPSDQRKDDVSWRSQKVLNESYLSLLKIERWRNKWREGIQAMQLDRLELNDSPLQHSLRYSAKEFPDFDTSNYSAMELNHTKSS